MKTNYIFQPEFVPWGRNEIKMVVQDEKKEIVKKKEEKRTELVENIEKQNIKNINQGPEKKNINARKKQESPKVKAESKSANKKQLTEGEIEKDIQNKGSANKKQQKTKANIKTENEDNVKGKAIVDNKNKEALKSNLEDTRKIKNKTENIKDNKIKKRNTENNEINIAEKENKNFKRNEEKKEVDNADKIETEKIKNDKINENTENVLEKNKEIFKIRNISENKKNILSYVGIVAGVLLLILIIVFVIFSIRNYIKNDVISNGIYIYGIDVSNMSRAEAETVLSQTFEEILDQNIVLISDEDYETYIEASEIDLEYDISSAVDAAYQIGKNGNLFTDNYEILNTMINGIDIMPTYSINEEKLATILEELSADLPNAVVEGSYYIEDTTLVITKGTDGYIVNVEETLEKVKESIESFDYLENSITLVLSEQSPEEIDLDAIYEEVYQEATDAYYTTDPYAVYPSSTGLDFSISLDEAKELLEEAESECEIELTVLYPSVTTNDIEGDAFPDLLASYTTKYDTSNTNRVTNLKLAASKIDGTVLLSGDTFSYNQVVGERTIAAGYKEAGIYVNGEVTNGLGGGICQISTTLFNAALLANLEMVEVHNHQMIPSYSSAGRDATVVYGTKDFQFSNSRNYAIKIECSVSGGVVSFKIYGVEEETEYDVSISAKITSQTSSYIKSKTYRTLSLNGETVSTELIYSCTYKVSD